ncbi:SDR family NAD(P)-dependent oxidoreductase [Legionella sp. 16cNR16C]|uniref:SDR family NAD(P)-dependent oxidoreductase n=1 Tax=Legionella sp. 16cNR16C TaxID=2905656 RepID=UPI001E64A6AE|nr:SDR family NAD(P)-dependent oxidoreductase [Legionella sp. 16cNR16C]MCE3045483.1 SDR family NAD(P)-dependent oxidoreductase [Legionella sp. 16cNR16C]
MSDNRTVVITAGNRGGGLALSRLFAARGARIAMIAEKVDSPEQTPVELDSPSELLSIDFDDEAQINEAVEHIITRFKTIDVLINNFSVFNFKTVANSTAGMFNDVMKNVFATFFFSKASAVHLKHSANPHIINISPPFHMDSAKLACQHHLLFSISKYGMSFTTMGMAEEFKPLGIAVNSLWQERPVATKTLLDNFANQVVEGSNYPEIYAEAAYLMSLKPAGTFTGNYCIDESILIEAGIDPLQYAINKNAAPVKDIFLPGVDYNRLKELLS